MRTKQVGMMATPGRALRAVIVTLGAMIVAGAIAAMLIGPVSRLHAQSPAGGLVIHRICRSLPAYWSLLQLGTLPDTLALWTDTEHQRYCVDVVVRGGGGS